MVDSACNVGTKNLELAARNLYIAVAESRKDGTCRGNLSALVADVETAFSACLCTILPCRPDIMPRTSKHGDKLMGHSASSENPRTSTCREHSVWRDPVHTIPRVAACITGSCAARGQAPCVQRRRSAAGPLECVGADLAGDVYMAALFEHLHRTLAQLRSHNDRGRAAMVRRLALDMRQAAAVAGCLRVVVRAERVAGTAEAEGYVMREALDDLELEIDAAEALWRAAGWVM